MNPETKAASGNIEERFEKLDEHYGIIESKYSDSAVENKWIGQIL